MSERRETVADIVDEMRHGLDKSWHEIDREWARSLPDRVEAAAKRESGNTAYLRETLKAVVDSATVIMGCLKHKRGPVFNIAKNLIVVVQSALAAPLRNCDVGTAEEQAERFKKFCSDHQAPWHGCTNCPVLMSEKCAITWAQMPYESEVK